MICAIDQVQGPTCWWKAEKITEDSQVTTFLQLDKQWWKQADRG